MKLALRSLVIAAAPIKDAGVLLLVPLNGALFVSPETVMQQDHFSAGNSATEF
jgi:hypothetical protein